MPWRCAVVLALALGGCGRLAFDPLPADATGDAGACRGDFVVDTAADDPALSCQGAGCSLRAAFTLANQRGAATICIAGGLKLAVATPLVANADITVVGSTASVCGTGASRVFEVATGALRLRDLTVCGGRLTDAGGAAVLVDPGATLDVDRVVFDDNVIMANALAQEGGAIHADGDARITIRNTHFTNNHAVAAGPLARGGAFGIRSTAGAQLVIEDTSFEDNTATDVGGGMFLVMDGAKTTLQRLLFARNTANSGAAIDINCASTGTIVVDSSTFVDNPSGGGVIFVCGVETVRLAFCSFTGNSGLVQLDNVAARAEWQSNAIEAGAFDLCFGVGSGASLDHNVTTRLDAVCPLTAGADHNVSPMFAALAANGGPTATLALLPASPAIDAGGATCPAIDQRGTSRPIGAACDAGAFEAQ